LVAPRAPALEDGGVPTARRLALLLCALALAVPAAAAADDGRKRPNVVVIITDDQDFRSMPVLPKTRRLIGDRGTTFAQAIVNFPLCCPSRATFYSGRYAHNHGVLWNNLPQGGYRKFDGARSLPVWLRAAGYRTIHIGKYLNEYGEDDPREVPPGWEDWHGGVDPTTYDYYRFTINHNGRLRTYGRTPADYATDVHAGLAERAIRGASRRDRPFFMSLAPIAPHTVARDARARVEGTPALPPPRYATRFANAPLPRYPNFNPADISDKPGIAAFFPNPLNADEIAALQDHFRGRMGALLAVDDLVARVIRALRRAGEYRDTVIFFTSDNGWILGEHRLRDPVSFDGRAVGVKYVPYEGSSRVPLLVAGPRFPEGRTVRGVVSNADLSPTILELAGAKATLPQDGVSLLRAARRPSRLDRRGVLIETAPNPRNVPPYASIRTERYRYDVTTDGSGVEGLFDLARDPWELRSRHADPAYARVKAILAGALEKLRTCRGPTCRLPVPRLPLIRTGSGP
jgi:arylsulfatase A-like enzyme